MKKIYFIFLFIFFGCGYTPVANFNVFGDKVYVFTKINNLYPQISVVASDMIKKELQARLGVRLSPKKDADSFISANILAINFTPLGYDELGYIRSYNINVDLEFDVSFRDKNGFKKVVHGQSDYILTRIIKDEKKINNTISSIDKDIAIKRAIKQAVNEFIAFSGFKGINN